MKNVAIPIALLLLVVMLIACQVEERSNAPLTDEQKLNLELVSKDNVALYGSPPLIPTEHPIEIGEDFKETENGGEACLECHNNKDEEDAPQTLHPDRHSCTQCHIPASEESATTEDFKVANSFEKHIPK